MKHTRILAAILVVLLSVHCLVYSQQKFTIEFKESYNSFAMDDMKVVQEELLHDITSQNIPATITDNFPSFYGTEIAFTGGFSQYDGGEFYGGGYGGMTSTGGRISYKDYSGEVRFDERASVLSLGLKIGWRSKLLEHFQIDLGVGLEGLMSGLTYESFSMIGDSSTTTTLDFRSFSVGIQPQIVPTWKLNKFRFGISVAYLLCIPSDLEFEKISDAYLTKKSGEKATIDWSGTRFGIVVGIEL